MITDAPAVLLVEDHSDDEELTLRGLRRTNLTNPGRRFEVLKPCNMSAEIAPPARRLRHPTGAATRRALPLSP
jgi:hypothetical protein